MKHTNKISFDELRSQVNKYFGIRVCLDGGKSFLASLTLLAALYQPLYAEHLATKALRSTAANPTFRCKGSIIVFFQH